MFQECSVRAARFWSLGRLVSVRVEPFFPTRGKRNGDRMLLYRLPSPTEGSTRRVASDVFPPHKEEERK